MERRALVNIVCRSSLSPQELLVIVGRRFDRATSGWSDPRGRFRLLQFEYLARCFDRSERRKPDARPRELSLIPFMGQDSDATLPTAPNFVQMLSFDF